MTCDFGFTFVYARLRPGFYRDRAVRHVPLRSPAWRALVIGDSFTEGIGVACEDTSAGLAAAALAPSGIEVLLGPLVEHLRERAAARRAEAPTAP